MEQTKSLKFIKIISKKSLKYWGNKISNFCKQNIESDQTKSLKLRKIISKKSLKNLIKLRKQNIKFLETIYRIGGNKISKKSQKNL